MVTSLRVPDVEDMSQSFFATSGEHRSFNGVRHVGEAARLLPVSVEGDRLAGERLGHEPRDHAAIAALVDPRSVGVEVPNDRDAKALLGVGEREMFVHRL